MLGGMKMAFDISRLTSAVNKYLNSISDVASAAKKATSEIETRTQFSEDLKNAIRQNMEARSKDETSMPDIASLVQEQVTLATSAIDSQIEQINGSFEAIREAGIVKTSGNEKREDSGASDLNPDASKGTLSMDALQELSKSNYFSANLIQSSLFDDLSRVASQNEVKTSAETVAEDSEKSASSDLTKAIINAYKSTGSAVPITSIFGDFSL